jgi:hypothetical protein
VNIVQVIINAALTLLLPILVWIGYWIAQYQIQKMAGPQSQRLEQFARQAAQHVEYNHQNALDKKVLALAFTADLFKLFNLPVPPPEVLDIAVGSAMFEANRGKGE